MNKKIYNYSDISKLRKKGVTMKDILDDDSFKVYTPKSRELVPPERKREFFQGVGLFDVAKVQNKNKKFMT
tara:strand:- start:43 stop:255 length:213 start_codon:yes stop_codon:yes gene_type:complete